MPNSRLPAFVMAVLVGAVATACGGGSDPDAPIDATFMELTGAPNPATAFDAIDVTFAYPNNLTGGIWHQNSNQIVVGYYSASGYWSHAADLGGWPTGPDHDTGGTNYIRMVYCPRTNTVVYGTSVIGDPQGVSAIGAADLRIASIDRTTGALGVGTVPTFSDGYAGNCSLLSSSASELLILQDASTVRRYTTSDGSTTLQFVGTTTLSQPLPAAAVGTDIGSNWGGTFAWDGLYFYFTNATSFGARDYSVYTAAGTFVTVYTAAGSGTIHGMYFDWSVGRYAIHDGYGARSGGTVLAWLGGAVGDDTQCYGPVSTAHTLKP